MGWKTMIVWGFLELLENEKKKDLLISYTIQPNWNPSDRERGCY